MKIHALNTNTTTENTAISRIIIYGNGEILFTTDQGYFEEVRTDKNGKIQNAYDGRVSEITLTTEPKRARKENLNRKDNYTLSYYGRYSWQGGTALYIHCSEIAVTVHGEYIAFQNSGETNYKNVIELSFTHGITFHRCKMEEIKNAGKDFTPPDGCKWSNNYSHDPLHPNYDIIDRSMFTGEKKQETRVVKRWIEKEPAEKMLVSSDKYTRTVKDSDRENREKIAEYINKNKIFYKDVSHYEIERLLEHFEIKLKEGKTL